MSVLQGQPLPNVTETTTTAKTGPDYFDTHLDDLAKAGETAMERTGAESVAGYDPLQTMGYGALPGASTAYKPGLQAAGTTAAKAAAGITPGRIQALMNPYTTNVVNEMARLSNQNVERNLLPGMKAGFVGTGGLGGSRYANALGQSMADVQADLMGQQRGALSAGYTQALKGALDEAQLQNLTAKTQADIAKYEQELGLAGANAMTKAGAERQAYEQSILDAPMRTAKAASDLLRGYTVPSTETRTFTGPRSREYYQNSDVAKAGTLLTFLKSAQPALSKLLPSQIPGLTRFIGGLSSTLDLGGGIKLSLDSKGNPVVTGGVDTVWDSPSNEQLLRDWGLIEQTGTDASPNDASDNWMFDEDVTFGGGDEPSPWWGDSELDSWWEN